MNRQDALAWLTHRLQPTVRPEIDTDELEHLVDTAAVADDDDNAPFSDDWTETYSLMGLMRACAEGWDMKAAKVASSYSFSSDGQRFDRAQVHTMCSRMSQHYRRQLLSSTAARNPA